MLWSSLQETKDTKVRSKTYENQVERLTRKLEHKEEIEKELLARIRTLEEQVIYWRRTYEGVYI